MGLTHTRALSAVAALALILTVPAWAADSKNAKATEQFIREAAMGDMVEVQMGQLGERMATSPEVKEFARRMQQDHSAHLEKVRGLAAAHNVALPAELDRKHHNDVEKFSKMKGAEFDRQYMNHMVKDHQEDIQKYEKAQQQPVSPDAKALISETLPVLKEHHAMAQNIAKEAQARK